ncbi:MAG: N-6 DNA methylase [Verrucomicrobiae bacterium]|nr:N-6 DNA methylase [Verrucomicrobiae bacterium]
MVTNQLKSKIDALWLEFHSGGITNPITVIEQISYLMFARLLDLAEAREEKRAERLKKPYKGLFPPDKQQLRWSQFRNFGGEKMLGVVRDELFPFMRTKIADRSALGKFLKDANCLIPNGNLLSRAVSAVEELPLTKGDTKGDLYEYLLGKLSTAGIAGQFRTPRHIIRAMIAILDPKPDETICDPACGTAGFLIGAMEYLKEKYSTPDLVETDEEGNKHYPGDLLEPYREHIQGDMMHGFDFDSTMLRIAAMNLLLHGIEHPAIAYQDTLGSNFSERYPNDSEDRFHVIAANPPFKGTLDLENIDPALKSKVKTKKSELLFIVLILRMLNQGGRSAVIVPDGVLFGSSQAHVAVRKLLVDDNQLEAVISLPAGVFKPYAGVSTAILVFTKGGRTDEVWFYDVEADGFSLDDKRTPQPGKDDLPDMVARWNERDPKKESDRTEKHFFVPVCDIRANKYDLSLNRSKETKHEEASYDPPKTILKRMRKLEKDILKDIDELEGMLK